jgi:tetratricopeptide (TPR) repeat protein
MLAAIAPDDVKAKFDEITKSFEGDLEPGLAAARAHMRAGNVAEARTMLEDLIRQYGAGTGLFLDDSVSEYRRFANDFEAALYVHLYPSEKHLRKLPQDRAALYTDYGALLLELRDTDGAEAALREALRVNPVSTDAMFELGEVMKLTGRKREFRELTLRAMVVAHSLPTLARAYRNLGYLAVEDEDFDIAVACYCMSLAIDRERAQAAQSELFYIQQVTGRTLELPDRPTIDATLARSGIQVGPSPLVRQLMDSAA